MNSQELLGRFESLGGGCEFGVFQRFCAAEPLGLFRFAASRLININAVLDNGLKVLDDSDLSFRLYPDNAEYFGFSQTYNDFDYHTTKLVDEISLEKLKGKEVKRLAFLREKLASTLTHDEKILVRLGSEDPGEIRRLVQILRRWGSRWLLWVDLARDNNPPGSIEVVEDGLLKGYVSHFATFHDGPRIDIQAWLRLCQSAYTHVETIGGRPPPIFESAATIESGTTWRGDARCRIEPCMLKNRPRYAASRFDVALDTSEQHGKIFAVGHKKIPAHTFVVFSTWVWVSRGFVGYFVEAGIDGLTPLHFRRADPKQCEMWQQIWFAAETPNDEAEHPLCVRVAASSSESVTLAGWQLETGSIPTERNQSFVPNESAWQLIRSLDLGRLYEDRARTGAWLAGVSLNRLGCHAGADALLQSALERYPDDILLLRAFARSGDRGEAGPRATDRWTSALRAAPGLSACHAGLAAALRRDGANDRAAAIIAVALRLFPDDTRVLSEAARIAHASGDYNDAVSYWQTALGKRKWSRDWRLGLRQSRRAAAASAAGR